MTQKIIEKAKETKTIDQLNELYNEIVSTKTSDYGEVCDIMVSFLEAAFKVLNSSEPVQGLTGFQVQSILLELYKRKMSINGPISIINFENFLYPDYVPFDKNFTKEFLQRRASEILASGNFLSSESILHLTNIIEGKLSIWEN